VERKIIEREKTIQERGRKKLQKRKYRTEGVQKQGRGEEQRLPCRRARGNPTWERECKKYSQRRAFLKADWGRTRIYGGEKMSNKERKGRLTYEKSF